MKKSISLLTIVIVAAVCAGAALAQDLIVFPAKGQSNEQMEKEKFECYSWAKGQTGFDPMQMPTASSAPPPKGDKSVGGSTLRGGVAGGAVGAIIGGIASGSSGAKKGLPSVDCPVARLAGCAAHARTSRPISSVNSGRGSRPTNTRISAILITVPMPPAWKARDTP